MKIPTYKIVRILSENKLDIDAQLKGIDFGQAPYIFDLNLLEDPQAALNNIENFIIAEDIPLLPYPLIVLSKAELDSELLDIYPSTSLAPRFYNQKTKTPNVKEQSVLAGLDLKRKNFENLKSLNYYPVLKKYSVGHKMISDLAREAQFYEYLLAKLKEGNNGQ